MAATEKDPMEDMVVEDLALTVVEDMAEEAMVEEATEAEDMEDTGPGPHTTADTTDIVDADLGDLPRATTNFLFMKEATSALISR